MIKFLQRHFGLVITSGIVFGILLGWSVGSESGVLTFLEASLPFNLFLMLLLATLKTNLLDFLKSFKRVRLITFLTISKMIILPVIVYFLALMLPKEYLPGLVLLAASPAAVAGPSLLMILKGDINLGLVLTVVSNLIAPITMPLVLKYTVGTAVALDFFSIFLFLLILVTGPFILAYLLEKFKPDLVKTINKRSSPIATLLIFIFMISVFAPYSEFILQDLAKSINIFALVVGLSLFFHFYAFISFMRSKADLLVTGIIIFAYFNAGLSIVVANEYFDSLTVLVTVFYEFVWAIGLIPIKMIFAKEREDVYNSPA